MTDAITDLVEASMHRERNRVRGFTDRAAADAADVAAARERVRVSFAALRERMEAAEARLRFFRDHQSAQLYQTGNGRWHVKFGIGGAVRCVWKMTPEDAIDAARAAVERKQEATL